MGLSKKHYREIMFQYDKTRMRNQQLLDARFNALSEELPTLKEIHDKIIDISMEQAKSDLLHPELSEDNDAKYQKLRLDLIEKKLNLLEENGYPRDYLSPIYQCKDCKDTGYIGRMPCHCFTRQETQILYENSNLMQILDKENFDTFDSSYYRDDVIDENLQISPRQNIIRVKDMCVDFVNHFDDVYDNLIFYGNTGVGKTFLTHCIAKELLDSSHQVLYLTSKQLFDILEKNRFRRDNEAYVNEQIAYISSSDLLIIDDLGTEVSNSFTTSELFHFVEERHAQEKSTIFSTNLSFGELRDRYSERLFSRFTGYYHFFMIVGDDIRIHKTNS